MLLKIFLFNNKPFWRLILKKKEKKKRKKRSIKNCQFALLISGIGKA